MLKQLRKRFIMVSMLFVGIVLLCLAFIICYKTYTNQMDRIDRSLTITLEHPFDRMAPFSTFRNGMFSGEIDEDDYSDNKDKDTDMSEKFGTAKVILDSSKNVYSVDSTYLELSDEQIEDAANKVIAANTSEGKLKKYKLYYKASFGSSYSVIAFADYSAASEEISATIIFTILLFSGTMLIFLLISIWLSGYAMKPVAKAWAQQQQFVADASHELKTPLTAILATNNILLSNPDLTIREQEKWIENSQAEANHMKDLIANMLFLAKSEDEQVQLVLSEISLSDIVTDTTLQFEPVAFENGTLIDSSIEEAITIQGDLTQMRQLVHILIDNACKYAGESGYVKVCLRREGGTIKLEVCNSGKPIPAEDLPHIFERFYRSDKARTQQNQSGGYGLGLAIAKSIADRHKAQISAASSEEGGTTFTVIFKNK